VRVWEHEDVLEAVERVRHVVEHAFDITRRD
jgi:hypothetical protein